MRTDNNPIEILQNLIACKSVTPNDDNCQTIIGEYLKQLGFEIKNIKYGDVNNMIAKLGTKKPTLAFVGHTDVVPIGDIDEWAYDPFSLTEENNKLYGRGTSDMKGSIAAFLFAVNSFLSKKKSFDGSIMMILTSDEEGPAINGIRKLVDEELEKYEIDMCLVGEPSCKKILGDTIKNGRRGSLSGKLIVSGIQGHIAYPMNAENPIHTSSLAINELINKKYDEGNEYFPPTSFQISNLNSGVGAGNIIPGKLTCEFNFRYSTETNSDELKNEVTTILNKHKLNYDIEWTLSGEPYLSEKSILMKTCSTAVKDIMGMSATISTDGGTSDGRFMAKICKDVIEFGLVNETIHKVNEHTTSDNVKNLSAIYSELLSNIFNQ